MHADDIALSNRLQEQVGFLQTHKELDAVGSHCKIIDPHDKQIGEHLVFTDPHQLLLDVLLKGIPFLHPSVMYRRTALSRTGIYNSLYDGLEDHDLWLRMAGAGVRLGNVPSILLQYRTHNLQVSQNFTPADIEKNYRIYIDFVHSLGMKQSEINIRAFCDLCNRRFRRMTRKDVHFFLGFFEELLSRYEYLTSAEKIYFKKLVVKKLLSYQSRKTLNTYLLMVPLFRWKKKRTFNYCL
jgi:hypothetical protein